MEKVKVRIEGISPLLQHRYAVGEKTPQAKARNIKSNEDDYESYLYKDENGVIWPAESMQEVENLLDDFWQMGISLKEYIDNPKRPEWILSGKYAEIRREG